MFPAIIKRKGYPDEMSLFPRVAAVMRTISISTCSGRISTGYNKGWQPYSPNEPCAESHNKAGRGSILTGKGALQWCLSKGTEQVWWQCPGPAQSRSPDKTPSYKAAPSWKSSPGLRGREWAESQLEISCWAKGGGKDGEPLLKPLKVRCLPHVQTKPALNPEWWDVLRTVTVRSLPRWNCPIPPSPFPQSPHFKMPACQGSQEQNTLQLLVPCLAIGYIYMVIPA